MRILDVAGSFSLIPVRCYNPIYNQGHLTWPVTPLLYLPFSLLTLFGDGFSVDLYNVEANIERKRERDAEHNNSTFNPSAINSCHEL